GSRADLRAAREERAECLLTLAGDFINGGAFDDAVHLLEEARPLDPNRSKEIEELVALFEEKESAFRRIEQEDTRLLKTNPGSAAPAAALSDLYAAYSRYEEAWTYLERVASASEGRPEDSVLREWAFRIRSGSPDPVRKLDVDVDGLHLTILYAREEGL